MCRSRIGQIFLPCFLFCVAANAQLTTEGSVLASPGAASLPEGIIRPLPPPSDGGVLRPRLTEPGVDWNGVIGQSVLLLSMEHAFRLGTEPGTCAASGSLFKGYAASVANLHGWADGDEFYVNYVGHPMQGGIAGFLWSQNDRRYRSAEFGKSRAYWKARLRAGAFAWVYSTQFELGPVSEASIGQIQSQFPQQGFVDHVVTPVLGVAWMIGEDVVDKYVVQWMEDRVTNHYVRLFVRGALNPARGTASMLAFQAPWHRTTRGGIMTYRRGDPDLISRSRSEEVNPPSGVAPFEFTMMPQYRWFAGNTSGASCVGGGGSAAVRVAENWQAVFELGGCKLLDMKKDFSGDSLSYMAGPRWSPMAGGRWNPHFQVLLGGNKFFQEQMFPEKKRLLESTTNQNTLANPIWHDQYTVQEDSNGFALSAGGGLDLKLNSALAIRLASVDYRHSFARGLNGNDYSNGLQVSAGMVLRMGTW